MTEIRGEALLLLGVNHGWTPLYLDDPDPHFWKPADGNGSAFDDLHRCMCLQMRCAIRATQEDGLCDGCRADCKGRPVPTEPWLA